MLSPSLSLDAIVTAIACLCSTTNVREEQVSTLIRLNNHTLPKNGFWNQLNTINERLTNLESKLDLIEKLLRASMPVEKKLKIENCEILDLKADEVRSVEYEIPFEPFIGVCKRINPHGNWLVIQRRVSDSVSFNRNWDDYKAGFGRSETDFFIGLEHLYKITAQKPHQLLIRLKKDLEGEIFEAHYDRFEIETEKTFYALKTLGKYHGTAGDCLTAQIGQKFSTYDLGNIFDAKSYEGGWWFGRIGYSTARSHLNGIYIASGISKFPAKGIHWCELTDNRRSLVFVEMLIKPAN